MDLHNRRLSTDENNIKKQFLERKAIVLRKPK